MINPYNDQIGIRDMRDWMATSVQDVASGKMAFSLGIGGVTSPAWLDIIQLDAFKMVAIAFGVVVSITVILVNIQSFRQKLIVNKEIQRQEHIKTALLEREAKEKDIFID